MQFTLCFVFSLMLKLLLSTMNLFSAGLQVTRKKGGCGKEEATHI